MSVKFENFNQVSNEQLAFGSPGAVGFVASQQGLSKIDPSYIASQNQQSSDLAR